MTGIRKTGTILLSSILGLTLTAPMVSADVAWTQRETPQYTSTDTHTYVTGSWQTYGTSDRHVLVLKPNGEEYQFGTYWSWGGDGEKSGNVFDKTTAKMCVTGNVGGAGNKIFTDGSTVEMVYDVSGWLSRWPLTRFSYQTAVIEARIMKGFSLLGSNDGGQTWDAVFKTDDAAFPNKANTMFDFDVSPEQGYSKYKLSISSSKSDPVRVEIGEFALWTGISTVPNYETNPLGTPISVTASGYEFLKDGQDASSLVKFGSKNGIAETIDKLTDGNPSTKMCTATNNNQNFFTSVDSVSIDFDTVCSEAYGTSGSKLILPEHISLTTGLGAYSITTGNDAPERDPQSWVLYGSNNGQTWTAIDSMENAGLPQERCVMATIPAPEGTDAYRSYRLEFTGSKKADKAFQLSEVNFWGTDEITAARLPLAKNVTLSYSGGLDKLTIPAHESYACLSDGLTNKFCVNSGDAVFSAENPLSVTFEMDQPYELWAYSFTTGNDTGKFSDRNPKDWELYGSNDGETWDLLDQLFDYVLPAANHMTETFTLNSDTAYMFYRFDFEEIGGKIFQLSEITFYGDPNAVPEPASVTMLLLGVFGLGVCVYRKKRAARCGKDFS